MKLAILGPVLGVALGLGLMLCACQATHLSSSSVAPTENSDQVWDPRTAPAKSGEDHARPAAPDEIPPGPTSPAAIAAMAMGSGQTPLGSTPHGRTAPGSVRTVNEPLRAIEGAPAGRVWLLEMYQSALAEKEELVRRAKDMVHERDAAAAHAAELDKARADLETRNAALAAELSDLRTKSLELARRLAESEIGRLEAEKAALEGRSSGAGSDRP